LGLDRELAELMRRAQGGDRLAYERLLTEVMVLVKRFAQNRVRHANWLEDVAQETLLAIHRDRHSYDPARPFLPWMYAIARHRLLDFAEKQRRRWENEVLEQTAHLEVAAEPTIVERGTPAGFLRQALTLLSLKQQEIIHLLKFEGFSVAEISRKTGISESSVKVTAHRGYRQLRRLMERPADEE